MPPKAKKYAIIDLETTGGMARRDKVIEIAIIVHDGHSILDQFDTLVNPERSIPYEITRITGINDDMVVDAPRFYEIGKKVVQMTEDCIFVAHNVRFDYSFIKEEFARLGYTYTRKQLCTVRMARKAFPGLPSYSLGNLIRHFGIEVSARHRALDDTIATVDIFERMLALPGFIHDMDTAVNLGIKEQKLPEAITLERLHALPDVAGVYYFHNGIGHVVYIGKSINIQARVMQHFTKITAKSEAMMQQVKDISYEITGSELVALLKESEEIKSFQPIINKAQRTKDYPYFVYHYEDADGYICFGIDKISVKKQGFTTILSHHSRMASAKHHLAGIRTTFELCETKLKVQNVKGSHCVYYEMGQCMGACRGIEDIMSYNERAQLAIEMTSRIFKEDFIVITPGRNVDERAIILVEDGYYRGYGFVGLSDLDLGIEELKECIDYKPINIECNSILSNYINAKSDYKLISF